MRDPILPPDPEDVRENTAKIVEKLREELSTLQILEEIAPEGDISPPLPDDQSGG